MALQESKKVKVLSITLAIFLAGVVLFACLPAEAPALPDDYTFDIAPTDQTVVPVEMDAKLFYSAVDAYPVGGAYGNNPELAGGIAPHHAVAGPLLAEFFAELARSNPDIQTFIILGPNHRNVGLAPAIGCYANWRTPLGSVATDYDLMEALKEDHLLAFDEENCVSDQAIQTLVPFIKYYFPQSKIAPVLFSSEEGRIGSLSFAEEVVDAAGAETFFLASLDFSHYLSVGEAEEKDAFTAATIERKDYMAISKLNSDYVDSPSALIAFLRVMELSGAGKGKILRHANSADFPGQGPTNTTSYFTMTYAP